MDKERVDCGVVTKPKCTIRKAIRALGSVNMTAMYAAQLNFIYIRTGVKISLSGAARIFKMLTDM